MCVRSFVRVCVCRVISGLAFPYYSNHYSSYYSSRNLLIFFLPLLLLFTTYDADYYLLLLTHHAYCSYYSFSYYSVLLPIMLSILLLIFKGCVRALIVCLCVSLCVFTVVLRLRSSTWQTPDRCVSVCLCACASVLIKQDPTQVLAHGAHFTTGTRGIALILPLTLQLVFTAQVARRSEKAPPFPPLHHELRSKMSMSRCWGLHLLSWLTPGKKKIKMER